MFEVSDDNSFCLVTCEILQVDQIQSPHTSVVLATTKMDQHDYSSYYYTRSVHEYVLSYSIFSGKLNWMDNV